MTSTIHSAITDFISSPVSCQTLLNLLDVFLQNEAERAPPNVHPVPFHHGYYQVNEELKQKLVDHLKTDTSGESFVSNIISVALRMRLHRPDSGDIQALCASITADQLAGLNTKALFEACNILQAQREWEKLAFCAQEGASRSQVSPHQRSLYCDWFILASYKMLVPLFEQNTLTTDHIDGFEAAVKSATQALPSDGKNRLFYKAIVANLRMQLHNAVSLILKAQKASGDVIALFQRIASFKSPAMLSSNKSGMLTTLDADCQHFFAHEQNDKPVLLISTDQRYFDKYVEKMLESYGYWNPDCLLHLHCVGFSPDNRRLTALERLYGVKINHTIDGQTFFSHGDRNFNGYCAGARYIHLPNYLTRYNKLIITDIDGVIRADLSKTWTKNPNAILLTGKLLDPRWRSARLMWEIIAAGSFGITASSENMRFATMLSTYLCEQMTSCTETGALFFSTDQIGLLLTYLRCGDDCVFEKCTEFYAQGGNWRFSEQDGKSIAQENIDFRKK